MNIIDKHLPMGSMNMNNHPSMIIVHHLEAEGVNWTVEQINTMHITEPQFGFSAIGYHYYIRLNGSVYKGRPDSAIGAHCHGCNSNTLGVAFEGDYDYRTEMSEEQFNAWCELYSYLIDKYGNMSVYGHRDNPNTPGSSECPGKYFPLDRVKAAFTSPTHKQGWNQNGKGWWYCTSVEDGYYYKDCWKLIDGEYYLFNSEGYAVDNQWIKWKDKWYYLRDNCMMAKLQWLWIDSSWYCFDKDGVMYEDCITPDGYTVDKDGSWVK